MEELNFITGVSLVLEIIAVLVITYKIEKKQLNKEILVKGFLLAVIMVFFSYFIQLTFSRTFPLISSFFTIFILLLMVYVLFNRYYGNGYIKAIIKTGITFLIVALCQFSLLPLIPIVSLVLSYDSMMLVMSYVAQLWIIAFMFFIYPRFRNRVNQMVLDFSKHPNYVLSSFFCFIVYVIVVTYIRTFLIDNALALVLIILLSVMILIGLILTIYKYFIKLNEDTAGKNIKLDMIEE